MNESFELLDPGAPGVDASLLRLIAALPDRGPAVVLGSPEDERRVAAEGLEVAGRVSVGGGCPRLWSPAVARTMHALDRGEGTWRTWSESSLTAAVPALRDPARLTPVVAAVATRPPWLEPWLRRRVAVRPIGFDLGPRLARRGWRVGPAWRVDRTMSERLPAGGTGRAETRPDRLVVAVPVEPVDAIDRWAITYAVSSAAVGGGSIVLVLPSRGGRWREVGRWFCGMVPVARDVQVQVTVDDGVLDPHGLAHAVDVAAFAVRPDRIGDVSLVTARAWLAAGVPVIAPNTRGFSTLVEDGVDGRLVTPGDRLGLARAFLRLVDDPIRREDMAHAAAARHGGRVRGAVRSVGTVQVDGSAAANASAASR